MSWFLVFGKMFNKIFILSILFVSLRGEQFLSHQRLTRKSYGISSPELQINGYTPSTQSTTKRTLPSISDPLGYRNIRDGDHYHSHNHDHNHHDHRHQSEYDDDREITYETTTGKRFGSPRNLQYAPTLPLPGSDSRLETQRPSRSTVSTDSNVTVPPRAKSNNNPKRIVDPNRMVYPHEVERDKAQQPQTPAFKPLNPQAGPRNCSFGLCEEVEDYPEQKILSIISRSKDLQHYFTPIPVDIDSRFGDDGDDTMCTTMLHTQFPRSAMNTNNEEKLLVNVGEYKQGVVYETCKSDGKPCKYSDIFPNDYTAICKQKYTVRRLMTVGKDSDKAVFDNFHLPSCCVCVIKKT